MKHRLLTLAAAAGLAVSASFAGGAQAAEGRFAAFLPPGNPVVGQGAEPFIERVAKDTNGELTYKLFAGGALLGGKNMVEGLQTGVADIGQIVFGYFPAEFPYATLIADMAIYGSNAPAIAAAVTEFALLNCTGCLAEFKALGLVHLGGTSTSPYVLMSRDKIETLDELKGKKVRTPGALWDRWVRDAGGTPVNISAGEIYEAMSRGQVDAVLNAFGAMKSHSLWDAAKHVTNLQLGTYRSWGIFTVSARHWESLSPAHRRVLLDNAARGILQAALGYIATDDAARAEIGQHNVSVHEPSDGMRQQLANFLENDRPSIVENAKTKLNIPNPEPLMDTFVALVEKWETLYAPLGKDLDKMTELLMQEVYSKIDEKSHGL